MNDLNWYTIIIWSIGALVTLGITWGWTKSRIIQHDKDISKAVKTTEQLRIENRLEHKHLFAAIDKNREVVNSQYAEIKEFMGAVKTWLEKNHKN